MFVKNVKPAVVVLNGRIVVAPLQVVEVSDTDAGVKRLLASGHLIEAAEIEAPQEIKVGSGVNLADLSVNELKEFLKNNGIDFAGNAKKTELLELAETVKAELEKAAEPDAENGKQE